MADIEYGSIKVETILEADKNFDIVLPFFQRDYVWGTEQQKRLLASMLAGVPIGSTLFLKGAGKKYAIKPLCFKFNDIKDKDNCQYLLDGQQRISTIKSMFSDLFSGEEIKRFDKNTWQDLHKALDKRLRDRWVLKIIGEDRESEDYEDVFGFNTLDFDSDKLREPSDYEPYIDSFPVNKNSKEEYMPGSSEVELIKWAVFHRHMPLWLLNGGEYSYQRTQILKQMASQQHTSEDQEQQIDEWAHKVNKFLEKRLLESEIATVILPEEKLSIGISIFEQVNKGGTPLDIYDLIVACMARHNNKNLTDAIRDVISKPQKLMENLYKGSCELKDWEPKWMNIWDDEKNTLSPTFRKFFKNCLPIAKLYKETKSNKNKFSTKLSGDCMKEKAVLKLSPKEIHDNWRITVDKLLLVMQFLQLRCGIVKAEDLPYKLLIVPLFICCLTEKQLNFNKMEYWYWVSLFSGAYKDKQNVRIMEDSKGLLKGGCEQFTDRESLVFNKIDYSDKVSLLRTGKDNRHGLLDKAILQYIVSKEPFDLKKQKGKREKIAAYKIAKKDMVIHEHHIIPIEQVESDEGKKKLRSKKEHPVNSPLNRVLVSDKANYEIKSVSKYREPKFQLDLESNVILKPNDYLNKDGKCDLKRFLSDRFKKVRKDIMSKLENLKAL